MNKYIVVASSACMASLAAGAVGGYFFAYKKAGKEFDERLERELDAQQKRYSLLMMARGEKPTSPADLPSYPEEEETEGEVVEEPDDEEILRQEVLQTSARKAMTDYQGISTKGVSEGNGEASAPSLITNNIFRQDAKRPVRPPKPDVVPAEELPYGVPVTNYLSNPFGYEQEDLRYFADDDTLLDYANEVVENDRVGQANLDEFKAENPDAGDHIYVRNEMLGTDYSIQYMTESLTEYLGLSDSD